MPAGIRKLRTLLFSTLYPSSVRPSHGIFVETRLRHLLASGEVETHVVAPVPWFPFRHRAFGEYARYAAVPTNEERNGIKVDHPRYPLLPKVGMNQAPASLARTGLLTARKLIAEGFDFDLIDAHYFYPDGVAATIIGKSLGKPVVITGRGSDINVVSQYTKPKRMILAAANEAQAIIAVSGALKGKMVELGMDPDKITVLGNGVDAKLFSPEDRQSARDRLGVHGFDIASVGNLIPTKGHDLVIQALMELPDATLLIAGIGPDANKLRDMAAALGVSDRVRLLGVLPQQGLRTVYSAADCLVLASVREGWPNVILEAMACGTPVVASNVGGVAEIIGDSPAGFLLESKNSNSIVKAINRLRTVAPTGDSARAHAVRHGWEATTLGQLSIFRGLMGERHA